MDEEWLINGSPPSRRVLILAHGAGAPMDHPFMESIAKKLTSKDLSVVRFNFPYMQKRQQDGRKRPPDRMPTLEASFLNVVAKVRDQSILNPRARKPRIIVGGKSMGGRVASHVADAIEADGLLCLGYPFHPPGKPDRRRTAHLESISTPTLMVQGSRDPFGKPAEVKKYKLSPSVQMFWVEDGDHSLKPKVSSGTTHDEALSEAATKIKRFLKQLDA